MSLDRKLDIAGIILVVIGVVTLFSLFTPNTSPLLDAILTAMSQLAGAGRFALPVALIVVGGWIVLRKYGDRLPRVEFERLGGVVMLYFGLLITLHLFAINGDRAAALPVAQAGEGGGFIGAFLLSAMAEAVGLLGATVVLIAWWVVAVVFTLGLSLPEIVERLSGLFDRGESGPAVQGELELDDGREIPINRPTRGAQATQPKPVAEPKPAPALTPKAEAGPRLKPAKPAKAEPAPATPAAIAPTAASPSFDQPLVIGAEQAWELPRIEDILEHGSESTADDDYDRKRVQIIEGTLASFGAPVRVVEINRGPTITQFGVEPDFVESRGGKKTKVKVNKITSLANDLALALSAKSIRIEAPVPGKGYVGIEVPNEQSSVVALRDVMESERFTKKLKGTLRIALGQDVSGGPIAADLTGMPHLLIAGTTGSGKSVCVNGIIACLLLQNTPDECKLLMVDPKRVELTGYNGVPHLIMPVIAEIERVVAALQWVTREMDERYRKFQKTGVRNIADYNARAVTAGEKKLPYLVIIIDELADLMMLAPDETERIITRLAQLARATGIHLILATQRPSVDVVTGLIKANFPARIAFAVASGVDSRVILDQPGAEALLGRGDMLFQSPDAPAPVRSQGAYVSDIELGRLVRYWKNARGFDEDAAPGETPAAMASVTSAPIPAALRDPGASATQGSSHSASPAGSSAPQRPLWDPSQFGEALAKPDGEDELLDEAIKAVREMKKASISLLQRRLRIGYTRAARLIDVLEEKGVVGPAKAGAQQREVIGLDDDPYAEKAGTAEDDEAEAPPSSKSTRTWDAESD
ncbi:MAG: DNA translocase FtsK 4TM domain-containing protein [Anaerolineales bacterium]|nr:DNA translocase FtsK 4TM domain-containing protein [Anaerolineales bacterium]